MPCLKIRLLSVLFNGEYALVPRCCRSNRLLKRTPVPSIILPFLPAGISGGRNRVETPQRAASVHQRSTECGIKTNGGRPRTNLQEHLPYHF